MAGLIGFALISFVSFRSDLEALRKIAKEDIYWSAAQLELELKSFLSAIGAFGVGYEGVDSQALTDRFDILWSRVELFRVGEVGERLRAYDRPADTVARLFDTMVSNEALVLAMDRNDPESMRAALRVFEPFERELHDLAVRIWVGEHERVAAARLTLRDNAQMSASLVGLALAIGVALLILMHLEARRFELLAAKNERLAEEARRAGEAKTRFLSMMSHELRTPMNGVLGLLALVRQRGLPGVQLRLIDQAARSAGQMIEMLTDVLDFSALDNEELELQSREFELSELRDALGGLFDEAAKREGMVCEVACATGANRRVVGDFNRIRQALNHLASHVIQTAGAREVRLDLSHAAGALIADLSFDYSGGRWRPEVMTGEVAASREGFATDSLGPAVARGLIRKMGGGVTLREQGGARMAVRISIPCRALDEAPPRPAAVLLDIRSPELEAACRQVLEAEKVALASAAGAEVDLALMDAGGVDEGLRVAALRRALPRARIVALGRPADPALFDAAAESPLDVGALRGALEFRRQA